MFLLLRCRMSCQVWQNPLANFVYIKILKEFVKHFSYLSAMGDSSNLNKTTKKQAKITAIFERQNEATSFPNLSISSAKTTPINSGTNSAVGEPVSSHNQSATPFHSASTKSTGEF